jgi:hypothetical protein
MTVKPLRQAAPALDFGGDLQRQLQPTRNAQSPRLLHPRHQSLGRPYPGCTSQRSLLAVLEELTTAVQSLTTALVGEDPQGLTWGPEGSGALPHQEPVAPGGLTPEEEAQLIAELTDSWDAPWYDLSVVELRSLLRDLPIDRSALPRPIEVMRRQELLDALQTLPAASW